MEPLVQAAPAPPGDPAKLRALLGDLGPLITGPSTPPDLSDEMCVYCFASRLRGLALVDRPTLATPEVFRLFNEILSVTPPPRLVDAICLAIDSALRMATEINTTYAAAICTPGLAKALSDLAVLGPEYASSALFAAMRYVVDSDEFKALSAQDSLRLVRLCLADNTGIVRRTAQQLHEPRIPDAYSTLAFPKPDFPLSETSLWSLADVASFSPVIGFYLTDPSQFDVSETTLTKSSTGRDTVVVLPSVARVWCFFSVLSFLVCRGSGSCQTSFFSCLILCSPATPTSNAKDFSSVCTSFSVLSLICRTPALFTRHRPD
jgi:hypothetical protein